MVPPSSISRSAMRPIVGLQLRPDVVSDPPHSTPTTRSEIGHGSRRSAGSLQHQARRPPRSFGNAVDRAVRLQMHGFDGLAGRPDTARHFLGRRLFESDQEDRGDVRDCVPVPASESKANSRSRRIWPRTKSVVTGMVPSTACAIARVTGLQLSMMEITATQLRTPTAPFSRRKPRNVFATPDLLVRFCASQFLHRNLENVKEILDLCQVLSVKSYIGTHRLGGRPLRTRG